MHTIAQFAESPKIRRGGPYGYQPEAGHTTTEAGPHRPVKAPPAPRLRTLTPDEIAGISRMRLARP